MALREPDIKTRSTLIAVIGLAVAVSGAAIHPGEPIPGVVIYLGKHPGGSPMVVATSGRDGRVSARVGVERGG